MNYVNYHLNSSEVLKRVMGFDEDFRSDESSLQRNNVLALIESYVTQMLSIRKTLLLVFVSGVILAPVSMILSIYIFTHPSFDDVLERQDNFGESLEVLLVAIFASAALWFAVSLKQYHSMGQWDRKYKQYLIDHLEHDKKLMQKYGLSEMEP